MKPQYIEFNGKHPKDEKNCRKYSDRPRTNWDSYGVSYDAAFLKLDIDDYNKSGMLEEPIDGKPRSDAIMRLLDALKIRYNGIKTERGKHLFFRAPEGLERKNKINWYCPLGVRCEWKYPSSDDHIPLVINGVERKFFKGSITNEDVDELPPFLYPLQKSKDRPFEMDFPEGDRTDRLCKYLFHLVTKGYTAQQVFQIIELMNEYVFESPISKDTLHAEILNNSTLEKLQTAEKEKTDKKRSPSELAKEIIEHFNIITVNGDFYSYENGVYKEFPNGRITKYLTENYPSLTANQEREITRHISGLTYTEIPKDDGTVNMKNGILRFDADGNVEHEAHSMEHISFKQFNATYDPNAQSKLLDDTLQVWFNGSSKQIELFNQLLGYLLMNHVNYQKVFFFIGAPSTGKSTLLKLIIHFCGEENVSAIQLEDNIFSDIRKTKVLASETFKMLVDGSPLQINRKFKKDLTYSFTGKLLFGMNSYPDFSRDFDGIERRVIIFEFSHIFKRDDANFNPNILEDLKSNECMSALLNKAISGYRSLINNKGFIVTKESEKALADFVSDNNNVVKWIHECDIDEEYLLREPIRLSNVYKGSYPEYHSFCMNIGEEPKAQTEFSKTIRSMYGFTTKTKVVSVNLSI